MALLLESAPAVVYSFKATGDFAPTFISENVKRVLGYCPDAISLKAFSRASRLKVGAGSL